jgi:hypothetical protein
MQGSHTIIDYFAVVGITDKLEPNRKSSASKKKSNY